MIHKAETNFRNVKSGVGTLAANGGGGEGGRGGGGDINRVKTAPLKK